MTPENLTVESKPRHVAALAVSGMIDAFRKRLPNMDPEQYGGPEFIGGVIRELDALDLVVEFYGHASPAELQDFVALLDRYDDTRTAGDADEPA